MLVYSLVNFETKYYQKESKFIETYWRNNLPIIKDKAYVINFDGYESIETYWITLYANGDNSEPIIFQMKFKNSETSTQISP